MTASMALFPTRGTDRGRDEAEPAAAIEEGLCGLGYSISEASGISVA
jgi:hypothetical protein